VEDEQGLVRRAQEGDREAWGRLYEENFDKVYRYLAVRVEEAAEAEDLTQQAFLKAFQALGSFHWREVGFAGWLFRIARNVFIDQERRKASQRKYLANPLPAWERDPEALVEDKVMLEKVISHLGELTAAQREVIKLRFGAGLSTQEVATVMGKKPGAIKALQHAALETLREKLHRG